jgi:hypothetical protein
MRLFLAASLSLPVRFCRSESAQHLAWETISLHLQDPLKPILNQPSRPQEHTKTNCGLLAARRLEGAHTRWRKDGNKIAINTICQVVKRI